VTSPDRVSGLAVYPSTSSGLSIENRLSIAFVRGPEIVPVTGNGNLIANLSDAVNGGDVGDGVYVLWESEAQRWSVRGGGEAADIDLEGCFVRTGVEVRRRVFVASEVVLLQSDLLNDVVAVEEEARKDSRVEKGRRVCLFSRRDSLVLPRAPAGYPAPAGSEQAGWS
jgi:hypothetical protein